MTALLAQTRGFSPLQSIQINSGAEPVSYSMGTEGQGEKLTTTFTYTSTLHYSFRMCIGMLPFKLFGHVMHGW
jgi:hypothetical protein